MNTKFTFVAIAAFAFSTTAAFGQPPQGGPPGGHEGPGGNPIMEALDPDHNHEISASEIANASKALKALDKNGDGVLNETDLGRMGPPQGGPPSGGDGGFGGPPGGGFGGPGGSAGGRGGPGRRGPGDGDAEQGQRVSDFASRLMAFDKNDNGKVEKDELPSRMQRVMTNLDKNGDDVLDASELNAIEATSSQRSSTGDRERGRVSGRSGRQGGRGARGEDGGRGRRGTRGGDGGPGAGAGGPPDGGGGNIERMIEHAFEFDSDGDGKLSREELREFAQNMPQPGGGAGMGGPGGRGGQGGMRGGPGGRGGRPGGR